MTPIKPVLAALAVLALALFAGAGTGTAAAAPVDSQADQSGPSGGAGPPGDLPGPVPDFAGGLLDLVGQFLGGVLDGSPGPAVSDAAGNSLAGDTVVG